AAAPSAGAGWLLGVLGVDGVQIVGDRPQFLNVSLLQRFLPERLNQHHQKVESPEILAVNSDESVSLADQVLMGAMRRDFGPEKRAAAHADSRFRPRS
ncbi:hypothetical protein, partial [Streptomyces fuscichromogenes]|uniref:hypothetical protein n=1 Tax=Streptomyces fuscichromogenes TaxID=1324013 RepID=UPI001E36C12B